MTPRRARQRTKYQLLALVTAVSLAISGCGDTGTVIRGAGLSTYIAAVTVADVDGVLMSTEPPAPGSGPSVTAPTNAQGITGGSTVLELDGSAAFRSVAVFVDGTEGHYLVELPTDMSTAQAVVTISGLVPSLSFDILYAVADANGNWGPWRTMALQAIAAAGGDIQVSVTWDSQADVDLHVIEPGGNEIYYGSPNSASGGELDIDANAACSTSTLTQENIGWGSGEASSGQYIVRVDYWDSCDAAVTNYIVTVSLRPGTPTVPGLPGSGVQTFQGQFTGEGTNGGAGDGVTITTFTF